MKLYLRGDKTQKAIAEDLGIDCSLLSTWCRSYSQKNAFPGHGNPQDQELHKLRRELRDTIEERDILKKAHGHLLNGKLKKFRFMKKYQKQFRVVKMAQILEVSLYGYYRWIRMGCPDEKAGDREMIDAIRIVQQENSYRTGSPRVHEELRKKGYGIGRSKVARLMSQNDLRCRTKRAYIRTTVSDSAKEPAPDLLRRDFAAAASDTEWANDITYVRTACGLAYLCVIIDLYSRRVVGWSLSKKIDTQLVSDALC